MGHLTFLPNSANVTEFGDLKYCNVCHTTPEPICYCLYRIFKITLMVEYYPSITAIGKTSKSIQLYIDFIIKKNIPISETWSRLTYDPISFVPPNHIHLVTFTEDSALLTRLSNLFHPHNICSIH